MFSIIMPTYNCEKYVEKAIKSVLAQTYSSFELIIIDDGSKDRTFQIAEKMSRFDKRVKVYKIEHGGVSLARNFGLEKACGESILFIDGDDSWKEDLLECCLAEKECEMILFGIQSDWYNNDEDFVYSEASMCASEKTTKIDLAEGIDYLISKYNIASPCNKVYKKNIIKQFDVNFSVNCAYLEDLKFNLDYLCHINTINIINKDLYLYRLYIHRQQLLKRSFKQSFVNADEIVQSAECLLKCLGTNYKTNPILLSILLKAYYQELCCRIYEKDKSFSEKLLKELNANQSYNKLLRYAKGKSFLFLRICKFFRLNKGQLVIIRKRYWK